MKNTLILFLISALSVSSVNADCFIAKDGNNLLATHGDCEIRYSPCSTFKIALALMGYDAGVLQDETNPEYQYRDEYEAFLESWKDPQTPSSWMKNSCVWYSQVLTPILGIQKFQDYVTKFSYGNKDISGDVGFQNGLTNCWLSSSLEISAEEQSVFLDNLLNDRLPVSEHAHQMTRKIMYLEDLPNNWKLYGKTGSGYLLDDARLKTDIKHGWFIGWIQKSDRRIVFVSHIVDKHVEATHAGPRAKDFAKQQLQEIINS